MHAIIHRYLAKIEGVNTVKATDVVPILVGIRAAHMMRIDTAPGAEEVLRRHGVELISLQDVGAFNNAEPRQRDGGNNCALSSAD
jgi:hypothetical protein